MSAFLHLFLPTRTRGTLAWALGALACASGTRGTSPRAETLPSQRLEPKAETGAAPWGTPASAHSAAELREDGPSGGGAQPSVPAGFQPPEVTPPYATSALPGDGSWTPFGTSGRDRAVEPAPVFFRTEIHPHSTSRFAALTVVAIDLGAVNVHWLPGTDDVGEREAPFAPGLVPPEHRERVLAVFNGGFQPRHGRWGMQAGQMNLLPPRVQGCTVALYRDGSVRLRSWPALAPTAAEMLAFRQTPPCLLEQGEVHADLLAGRDKIWGGQTPNIVTRRRSAVGIDATGQILFYAIGIEAGPRLLAEGLRFVGAHDAAELDVNWNWTRFLLFGTSEEGVGITSALVPGTYGKNEYLTRASSRDFFYIVRK